MNIFKLVSKTEGHSRQKEQPVQKLGKGLSRCWWLPQSEGGCRALQGACWGEEGHFFLNVYYPHLGPVLTLLTLVASSLVSLLPPVGPLPHSSWRDVKSFGSCPQRLPISETINPNSSPWPIMPCTIVPPLPPTMSLLIQSAPAQGPFLKRAKLILAPGPLHVLPSLPGMPFYQIFK